MTTPKEFKITLVRSLAGHLQRHKDSARGLGLRKRGHSVMVKNTPENLGMINAIRFSLQVEEI
jgi:large subunit ribosomal protein L30